MQLDGFTRQLGVFVGESLGEIPNVSETELSLLQVDGPPVVLCFSVPVPPALRGLHSG